MNDEKLDPRIDRMMAALYGELSESEERAFRSLLEKDETLRAEWEELRGTRAAFAGWEVQERVPRFVLLPDAIVRDAKRETRPGLLARWLAPLRGMRLGWSYALVPVAAAVAAFLFAESRFERKLEAHLAQAGGDPLAQRAPADAGTRPEVAIEDLLARPGGGSETSPIVPVSGTYVTRDEFAATQEEMIQSLAALLNQYDQREDQETLDLLQAMYERLNRQQLYDYRQLAGRVDDLGRELVVSRGLAEQKIEELLGPEVPHETGGQEAPIEEE